MYPTRNSFTLSFYRACRFTLGSHPRARLEVQNGTEVVFRF
jgi:hypothetical protein